MLRFIDHLTKEIHHIKLANGDSEDYEPALVIMDHMHPGKSFQITLGAMWKYLDPRANRDPKVRKADQDEFDKIKKRVLFQRSVAAFSEQHAMITAEIACIMVGETFAQGMKFLKCLGYNLAKMMQMFDITPTAQNGAQLLLWVQDALDDLKNAPPAPLPEDTFYAGEATLYEGSSKVGTKDMIFTESEIMAQETG
jgi:hypothetical protein